MLSFKGKCFPVEVILVCTRWYAAYSVGYRLLKEIMDERGVSVDHSTIDRWAVRFLPLIEKLSRKHKRKVRMWKYLYRAVDRKGKTVDFLPRAPRDIAAIKRLFEQAMRKNSVPEKISMDKSSADKAAVDDINNTLGVPITVRQVKYLNNIVEHDRRAVKSLTRPIHQA